MIKKNKITLLFGLPGAGKTTALTDIINRNSNLLRLSGGSLISQQIQERDRDDLRKQSESIILDNQRILVENFQKVLNDIQDKHVVFDGHCVVNNGFQNIDIPLSIISDLSPNQIIFFNTPPESIIVQRLGDKARPNRELEAVEDLRAEANRQILLCKNYASALAVKFRCIQTSQELENVLSDNEI